MATNTALKLHETAFQFPSNVPTPREVTPAAVNANELASSLFQSVSIALDGPKGIDPATLVSSFASLAGYAARWITRAQIAEGLIENDFERPSTARNEFVSVSSHVNAQISDMTRDSYASTLVKGMMAAGANWLPDVKQTVLHNFMAINSPTYPDFTVDEKYLPAVPPQAQLLMLWEETQRTLRLTHGAQDVAIDALAIATITAASASKHKIPMDQSGQLALETAIAMSKLNYAF